MEMWSRIVAPFNSSCEILRFNTLNDALLGQLMKGLVACLGRHGPVSVGSVRVTCQCRVTLHLAPNVSCLVNNESILFDRVQTCLK